MNKTTNKFAPEVRERAVRICSAVLGADAASPPATIDAFTVFFFAIALAATVIFWL
jgi:hypothetical protein